MEEEAEAAGLWASYENGYTRWVERLQGNVPDGADPLPAAGGFGGQVWNGVQWTIGNLLEAPYNIAYAVTHPGSWLSWIGHVNQPMPTPEIKQALMRFVYYGASVELFFALFFLLLCYTAFAMRNRPVMWGTVRVLEGLANRVGRFFAWAAFVMVAIQIVIIFLQRVFAVNQISFGFGMTITHDVFWWSDGLKLWNAMIVALCVTYTFVQGGHVRVDLVYSAVSHRVQRAIDMVGSLLFLLPGAVLIYMYSWFFLWRSLLVPPVSSTNTFDQLVLQRSQALRWNVETIGTSPNGFDAYWLFKLFLVLFCILVLLQAVAFFYRSFLEYVEGEASAGKYLDKDSLGEGQEVYEGTH
ncbi:MAG: TRAP-type mannitol/chloroaromatic compound transport system, small permease component [Rhodobacteraceae bacterium HLUCCA08]|nr:MAG: TRAP-type mannitol/chloroaromatic compound transport system, small permease component [Rhodobacteraceae bacterium HLUCCA08]